MENFRVWQLGLLGVKYSLSSIGWYQVNMTSSPFFKGLGIYRDSWFLSVYGVFIVSIRFINIHLGINGIMLSKKVSGVCVFLVQEQGDLDALIGILDRYGEARSWLGVAI